MSYIANYFFSKGSEVYTKSSMDWFSGRGIGTWARGAGKLSETRFCLWLFFIDPCLFILFISYFYPFFMSSDLLYKSLARLAVFLLSWLWTIGYQSSTSTKWLIGEFESGSVMLYFYSLAMLFLRSPINSEFLAIRSTFLRCLSRSVSFGET